MNFLEEILGEFNFADERVKMGEFRDSRSDLGIFNKFFGYRQKVRFR